VYIVTVMQQTLYYLITFRIRSHMCLWF